MGEVGIHLEDIVVLPFLRPFETGHIGRAEPELPAPFEEKEPVRVLLLHFLHGCGRPVRRAVVYDEYVEITLGEDRLGDGCYVLNFVVCGNNDKFLLHTLIFT